MHRAVFLDRDGVLNRVHVVHGKPHPPATLEEFELLPGVADAVQALHQAGYLTIVATNQPDVATGVQQIDVVESFHAILSRELGVRDIFTCYHRDSDGCVCRKPKPGMLLEAARRWNIDVHASFMVGDRWRDIEAGRQAGCRTILVQPTEPYREPQAENPHWTVRSLFEASQMIGSLRD
jgi:D-glycero-D-manno-heptose 1,7-bisphosphate phosphatase